MARGAVIRLLRDKISTQTNLTEKQKKILASMPEVTARKSRYSYGILVDRLITNIGDFDIVADTIKTNPEGDKVTSRMDWYLSKVREDRETRKIELGLLSNIRERK